MPTDTGALFETIFRALPPHHRANTHFYGSAFVEQSFEALFVIIHPRPEVGHDLKRPALAAQHLLLPFETVFLVMTRYAHIGDGFAQDGVTMKLFGSYPRSVITPIATRCPFIGHQRSFVFPASQCRRGDPQKLRGFPNAHKFSIHTILIQRWITIGKGLRNC